METIEFFPEYRLFYKIVNKGEWNEVFYLENEESFLSIRDVHDAIEKVKKEHKSLIRVKIEYKVNSNIWQLVGYGLF